MPQQETDFLSRRFQEVKVQLKKYIERRIELSVLESSEQFSILFANIAHQISGLVLLLCGGIFLMLGLAIYLGDVLNNPSIGFVIVAVPLLFIGLLFMNMIPKAFTRKTRAFLLREMVNVLEMTKQNKLPAESNKQNKTSTKTNEEKEYE